MEFKEENVKTFLTNFENVKDKIRNSNGCRLLELYNDKTNTNIYFTYSYWEQEQDLENYRNSDYPTKKIFFVEL